MCPTDAMGVGRASQLRALERVRSESLLGNMVWICVYLFIQSFMLHMFWSFVSLCSNYHAAFLANWLDV